jgi:uncharacterized SAM-binding protein YcdF (DUF218 family)
VQQARPEAEGRRSAGIILVAVAGFAALMANWTWPTFRFASPVANTSVLLVGFLLPWLAAWYAVRLPHRWAQILVLMGLLPLLLYTSFFGFFASMHLASVVESGEDTSFQLLERAPYNGSHVAIYRTNGGATTSFGISVRHERKLLPGLLLVRQLGGFYPASEAVYEFPSTEQIRVSVGAYREDSPDSAGTRVFDLKPYVYF